VNGPALTCCAVDHLGRVSVGAPARRACLLPGLQFGLRSGGGPGRLVGELAVRPEQERDRDRDTVRRVRGSSSVGSGTLTEVDRSQAGYRGNVDERQFELCVQAAVDSLPAELRSRMSNVAVVIDDDAPAGSWLLGLYRAAARGTQVLSRTRSRSTAGRSSACTGMTRRGFAPRSVVWCCTRSHTTSGSATSGSSSSTAIDPRQLTRTVTGVQSLRTRAAEHHSDPRRNSGTWQSRRSYHARLPAPNTEARLQPARRESGRDT
jgi:hypothetical protein